MKKPIVYMMVAALLPLPAAAQDDPLIDLLNNRSFDRDALIRQVEGLNLSVSPPQVEEEADAEAEAEADGEGAEDTATAPDSPESGEGAPQFRPLTPELPPGVAPHRLDALALILPLHGSGTALAAAEVFRDGCVDALQVGDAPLRVDTYAHDGSTEQAITAYQKAVEDGAQFVIGPMQRGNVAALHAAYPQTPIPTLLLQPLRGENAPDSNYYVLTMDIGEEAAELARLIMAQGKKVVMISDSSAISQRQKAAFSRAWAEVPGNPPIEHIYVYDPEADWQKLFNTLKDKTVAAEEKAKKTKQPREEAPVLFAAGNGDFIRRTRNFTPQGYVLYASSVFFSRRDNAQFLNNLRIMEMPWFVGEDVAVREFARTQIIARPALQQRFYALGADACRAAHASVFWHDGWLMDGASGTLQLTADTFRRRGVLSEFNAGVLRALPQ